MREFQIPWQGAKAKLVIREKLKAGEILTISQPPIVKQNGVGGMPEVNLKEYYTYLATKVVQEAPWAVQRVDILLDLDEDTFIPLCNILGNEFPLERFLSPALKLVYGQKLETQESPLPTESTLKPSSAESPSGK